MKNTTPAICIPYPHSAIGWRIGLILILSFITINFLSAQCTGGFTLLTESFEDHGNTANGGAGRYTSANDFYDTVSDGDYFGRVEGSTEEYFLTNTSSGNIANSNTTYGGWDGSFFYAAEDLDDTGGSIGAPDGADFKDLTIPGINITGGTNLCFSGLFARGETNPCGASTYDDADFVEIFYNVDGAGEVKALCFNPDLECNIPMDISNEPLHHDPDCDGDGGEGLILTNVFQEFTFTVPNGNSVDFRIRVSMDSGSEEFAFDYFRLRSDSPVTSSIVCPTVAAVSASAANVCENDPFDLTATGLATMDGASNMEQDFGIQFVYFTAASANPYTGGTSLGTVPFGSLTGGGTTAALVGASIPTASPTGFIYAILSPQPTDGGCRPSAVTNIVVNSVPVVTFNPNPTSYCINEGIVPGLSGGSPAQGTLAGDMGLYSGMGVIDGGNGMTYSFDVTAAGIGTHTLSYFYSDANGCSGTGTAMVEVVAQPAAPTIADIEVCEGESTNIVPPTGAPPMTSQFWSETFDEDGAGVAGICSGMDPGTCATNNPPTNGQWSVTGNVLGLVATSDFFQVNGGQLVAQDLDAEVCFLSQVIDISTYTTVDFSALVAENGDHETADYADVTLIVDGVPMLITNWMGAGSATHTLIGDVAIGGMADDDDWVSTTVTQLGLSGSTLQIELCAFNGAGAEQIIFDNITLTGTTGGTLYKFFDADPAVGMATQLAGPANSYDPMTTVATSPQSIWVVECGTPCDSEAEEVVVTVNPGLSITCPGDIMVNNDPGVCGAVVNYTAPTAASGCMTSTTFSYTGGVQTFTVPAGVTSISIEALGGAGQAMTVESYAPSTGGLGGSASGDLAVSPGDIITIYVGGEGTNGAAGFNGGGIGGFGTQSPDMGGIGFFGGSGGGASDIRIGAATLNDRVLVAGGGGGGGRDYVNGDCQPCGTGGNGGAGGALIGIDGMDAGPGNSIFGPFPSPGSGGLGGDQMAGGAGGDGPSGPDGNPGILGIGGDGVDGNQSVASGGAGGGYYGGGSGAGFDSGEGGGGGGGAGGSSYIGGVTNGATSAGIQTGNGLVTISYDASFMITQTAGLPSGDTFPIGTTTNTYQVTDSNGNTATCSFDVIVTDTEVLMITCPSDTLVDCGTDTTPASLGMATAMDNCSPVVSSTDVVDLSGCGGYTGTITRTWTATDINGNTATCVQVIMVQDTTAPTFTVPASLNLQCDQDPTDLTLTGDVTDEMDNCDMGSSAPATVWINEFHYDNVSNDAGEFIEIAGTAGFDLMNCSLVLYNGNGGTSYNTVALSGIIPDEGAGFGAIAFPIPGIQNGSPDGIALVCNGALVQFLSYEGSFMATNGPANGVTSTDVGVTETGGTPIGESLQLCGTGSTYGDFTWTAPSAESPGLLNACQTLLPPPPPMGLEATFVDMVAPACNGLAGVITRTWTLMDACGNVNTQVQTITILDNDPPTFDLPANMTIECSDDPNDLSVLGMPTNIMDNCDPMPMVSFNDISTAGPCTGSGTIMREWSVTDACGNATVQTQTITIDDTTPPTFTVPADVAIGCDEDPNDLTLTGDVTDAADNCTGVLPMEIWINEIHYDNASNDVGEGIEIGGTAGFNLAGFDLVLYNGNGGTTYNTVALSGIIPNQSNGFGTLFFPIAGIQNGSPDGVALVSGGNIIMFLSYEGSFTATNGPANGLMSMDIGVSETGGTPIGQSLQLCGTGSTYGDFTWTAPSAESPGAINACQSFIALPPVAGPVVTSNDIVDLTGCAGSGTIEREWTVTDDCGNALTQTQTITVEEPAAAGIMCPADVVVSCEDSTDPADTGMATGSVACGTTMITFTDMSTQVLNGTCDQYNYTITRTWLATDDCGGTGSCMQQITVQDITPPMAVCQDITIELDANGMATITASDIDNGSSDNCTPQGDLVLAASKTSFTCADLTNLGTPGCSTTIPVTLTVTDACGNPSTCVANVTVEDNLAPILTCPDDLTLTLDPGDCGAYLNYQLPMATDNCELVMTTTFLGTTFNDNNGFAGNMFDVTNVGANPITINSFDVHLETAAGTNHTVAAYYVTGGGTYVGNETNAAAWTLLGDVPVVSAGPGNPSPMPAGGLTIAPGQVFGIYIFQTDGGSNIEYTDGANIYNDGNMQIDAGLGRGTPIWTGGVFNPRTWNGNVHYTLTAGSTVTVTQTSGPSLTTGDFFPIGTYTYEWEAEDGCGNISTCDYTFVIEEYPFAVQSLACNNDGVQISLDPTCEATIGADDILEGGPYGCYDDYIVELFFDELMNQPVPGSPVVTGANIGQTLWVKITDPDNGNMCWGWIFIEDKHIPNLECTSYEFPCVDSIEPTAGGTPGFPLPATATVLQTSAQTGTTEYTVRNWDGCGDAILAYSDWIDDIDCQLDPTNPYAKIIFRTWTATDESGNSTQCEDTLSLVRATLADLVTPQDWVGADALLCDEKETTPPSDFCGVVEGWNMIDAGDIAGDLYVGHPSPYDELYPCGNVKWFGTGMPDGVSCGDINFTFTDLRINVCQTGSSEGCYKIVRTWTILDWCTGDLATHQQFIKIDDDEGPTITDIVDATISVAAWECEATYYVPEPWIMDNCSDIDGLYTVTATAGNVEYLTSIGRWVITELPLGTFQLKVRSLDCCGNATEVEVDITVEDLVPPYVTCEVFRTTSLTIDGTSKIWATAFDDGSADACGPVYFKVIRMEDLLGTDDGSNSNQTATECDGINGDDNLTRFGNQIYFDDYVKYCCEDIGVTGLQVKLRVFDRDPGAGPIDPNRMRPGGDLYGHYNDCWSNVTVEDKLAPFISCPDDITVSCDFWFDMNDLNSTFGTVRDDIADVEYIIINDRYCDGDDTRLDGMGNSTLFDPNDPEATYTKNVGQDGVAGDNCSVSISENVVDNLNCGQGTITRIFTATDPDGRTASCVQRITIVDCDPYFINDTNCFNFDPFDGVRWPCDFNSQSCGPDTDPSVAGEPQIFNEDNCSLVIATYDDEEFPVVPDACFKIKRIWTVTDWCTFDQFDTDNNDVFDPTDDGIIAGQWEYVQYIKVLNSTVPTFGACDDIEICGYNSDCSAAAALSNTVTDDCTPGDMLIVDFKIDADNDGTYDFVGANVSPYPYPNPMGLPILSVTYSDADGDGTYDVTIENIDYPIGTHRILWSAEDVCSNVGTCEYLFETKDCAKPTPKAFHGLAVDVQPVNNQVVVTAPMMDAGSFDNCCLADNPFRIASPSGGPGQTTPPSTTQVVFDCMDLGTQSVDLWVQDCNGNWDYVISYVNVQNNMGACTTLGHNISGVVENEAGATVSDVTVTLTGNATSMPGAQVTVSDGAYAFSNLEASMNYVVTPEKDIDYRNGISGLDIVLISRHLIGMQPLNSAYKMIAADVDNSESVNTFDIIALQKLLLYIDNEFVNNTSWRFVESNHIFTDITNPWNSTFPEVFSVNGLSQDEVSNFVAVKIGDVNGNAQTNATGNAVNRTFNGDLNFNINDATLVAGQEYTVAFKASDFTKLMGYQFTMNFDLNAVEIVDANAVNVDANFGMAMTDEGVITTLWTNTEATSLDNDEVVFSITLKAKSAVQLSNVINVNSRYTLAEAYNEDLELMNIGLTFTNENTIVASNEFALYQNQPNPFKQETMIGFNLPEAGTAILSIMDVSGKVLKVINADFVKGYNEVSVTRSEIAASGVLYYQLETDDNTATMKMIVVE